MVELPALDPSEAPRARLNEMVAAGNWPMLFSARGAVPTSTRVIADSGTCAPDEEVT